MLICLSTGPMLGLQTLKVPRKYRKCFRTLLICPNSTPLPLDNLVDREPSQTCNGPFKHVLTWHNGYHKWYVYISASSNPVSGQIRPGLGSAHWVCLLIYDEIWFLFWCSIDFLTGKVLSKSWSPKCCWSGHWNWLKKGLSVGCLLCWRCEALTSNMPSGRWSTLGSALWACCRSELTSSQNLKAENTRHGVNRWMLPGEKCWGKTQDFIQHIGRFTQTPSDPSYQNCFHPLIPGSVFPHVII